MDNQYINITRGNYTVMEDIPEKEAQPAKKCGGSCSCNKLDTTNWLADIPGFDKGTDLVEVRFKNTRKSFFNNVNKLRLSKGDVVAVEASPGHDIGIVSLTGQLVLDQMKRTGFTFTNLEEIKKVYRKSKSVDLEKWYQAIEQERPTMLRSRELAENLNLNMKIGDVEYQGDKTKAIFYYIADDRVDFRELIKKYAEEFKVRIEMKQIGARQEAGRIGGIGTCGRELCCSTFLTTFNSVTTNSARQQEVSLNPQKLAGQCGKLKCCLNYELKCYLDAQQDFPNTEIPLEIFDGTAYHQKTDIYRRLMWYSFSKDAAVNLTPVPVDRVKEILELNKKGTKVKSLINSSDEPVQEKPLDYNSPIGSESMTRFEDNKKTNRKPKRRGTWSGPRPNSGNNPATPNNPAKVNGPISIIKKNPGNSSGNSTENA